MPSTASYGSHSEHFDDGTILRPTLAAAGLAAGLQQENSRQGLRKLKWSAVFFE